MVGQPFNPYRLFTGIFIPKALVRSKLVSPGAKMAYGRLARYAGQDGRCFPAVSNLAAEIGIGDRQAPGRDCGSAYMEGDTPPDNFPSNCELAADGHTAAEVVECLDRRFAKKRYRPGGRYGPRMWNWFYTVIREHFQLLKRSHLPEPTRRDPGIYLDAQNQTKAQDPFGETRPEKLHASQR